MDIRQKIWLEKDGHVVFGKGREELLRAIDECKSLSAAVKKVGISYRGAWGRLKASEERLNVKLVEPYGKGMCLTAKGKALLEEYDQMVKDMDSVLNKSIARFRQIAESK